MSEQGKLMLGLSQINKPPEMVDMAVIRNIRSIRDAYRTSLEHCNNTVGLKQYEVAQMLGLDKGRFSNIINADRPKRNGEMRTTDEIKHMPDEAKAKWSRVVGNLIVDQYQSYINGTEIKYAVKTVEQEQAERIAELEAKLARIA